MDELRRTSVSDLMKVWLDMMHANTQHTIDNSIKWSSSLGYNKSIENVELAICEKLQITLLESKIMLNSKKKVVDDKERKLFKCKKRENIKRKKQKYLNKRTTGMDMIQTEIFHAHHAVTKLDNIIDEEEGEEEEEVQARH